jgi:hypothetical protein
MSAFGGKADIAQGRVTGGLRSQGQPWFRHRIRLAFDTDRPESVIDPEGGRLFWFAETAKEIWAGIPHLAGRVRRPARAQVLSASATARPFGFTQGRKH